mgnify:CR=1 FL=1|tara:strand:- start:718 stop:921 length:204 start_codon:yes stop_codon:yes gene_type:complete
MESLASQMEIVESTPLTRVTPEQACNAIFRNQAKIAARVDLMAGLGEKPDSKKEEAPKSGGNSNAKG